MSKLYGFIALTVVISFLNATASTLCSANKHLFFANGMNNSRQDARVSLSELRARLNDRLNEKERYTKARSQIAYNYDHLLPLELLEAYVQKKYENLDNFWRWINNFDPAPEWFKKITAQYLELYRKSTPSFSNTVDQEATYEALLDRGDRILIVAHSQGNLFSNEALNTLAKSKIHMNGAALLSVATPASEVFANGSHFTLTSDGFIRMIAIASPILQVAAPLAANVQNSSPSPERFDHDFVRHYLNGAPTGDRILNKAAEIAQSQFGIKDKRMPEMNPICVDWWNNIENIDRESPELCIRQCAVAPVHMGTFNCNSYCEPLCDCAQ